MGGARRMQARDRRRFGEPPRSNGPSQRRGRRTPGRRAWDAAGRAAFPPCPRGLARIRVSHHPSCPMGNSLPGDTYRRTRCVAKNELQNAIFGQQMTRPRENAWSRIAHRLSGELQNAIFGQGACAAWGSASGTNSRCRRSLYPHPETLGIVGHADSQGASNAWRLAGA